MPTVSGRKQKATPQPGVLVGYATVSILLLTGINILGVKEGKWTQNILTIAKLGRLGGCCGGGFFLCITDANCIGHQRPLLWLLSSTKLGWQ